MSKLLVLRFMAGVALFVSGVMCMADGIGTSFDLPGWIGGPTQPPMVGVFYSAGDLPALAKEHPEQYEAIVDPRIRDYADSHCAAAPDGKDHGLRFFPYQADLKNEAPEWKNIGDHCDGPGKVVIDTGRDFKCVPLPPDADGMLNLLKKYGGE